MATKKRKTAKRKKRVSGIAGFTRKVNADRGVKAASKRVKKLEADLKTAKKKKASARKKAMAKISKKSK